MAYLYIAHGIPVMVDEYDSIGARKREPQPAHVRGEQHNSNAGVHVEVQLHLEAGESKRGHEGRDRCMGYGRQASRGSAVGKRR